MTAQRRERLTQLCIRAIPPIASESDYWGRKSDRSTIGGMADVILELIQENEALAHAHQQGEKTGQMTQTQKDAASVAALRAKYGNPQGTAAEDAINHMGIVLENAILASVADTDASPSADAASGPGPDEAAVEAVAEHVAQWLGYKWNGLHDKDISATYPDWAYNGTGARDMQGGKPALRRLARDALLLAARPAATS